MVQTPKSQEIGIKFTIIVGLNFDKPNDVQELILCLSYFITTVPKIICSLNLMIEHCNKNIFMLDFEVE